MAKKITVIENDALVGIYIDGELKHEGRELTYWTALHVLGLEFEVKEANEQWLLERGDLSNILPDKLEDVVIEE